MSEKGPVRSLILPVQEQDSLVGGCGSRCRMAFGGLEAQVPQISFLNVCPMVST